MIYHGIDISKEAIAAFCKKHRIRRLALFGSILRDEFGPDSDIDVLVEFEPNATPGLALFTIEAELSEMLGHRVDLHTPGFLNKHFRDKVMQEAELQYEAA